MIDLHMHTKYSDGTDTVLELLEKVNKVNLKTISITDHNSCGAYFELENCNFRDLYDGEIIVGCEFTTGFKGRSIEVLGYGFDYKKIQEYLDGYYSKELINENTAKLYERLATRIYSLGLKCCYLEGKREFESEFFEKGIYKELIKFPENREILDEDIWDSFSDFYRKGLTNPKSKLFMNYSEFKPPLEEIIDVVQEAGGVCFLAHPYQYRFDDTEKFLKDIYSQYNFDGIECFYTTFSDKQTKYLLEFAKERGLLISGGSDYHGENKMYHDLGVGRGNLLINDEILDDWNVCKYC